MVSPIAPLFQWKDGELKSPAEVAREQKVAQALMTAAPQAQGFWGALGQVGSAASGSLLDSRADASEQQGREAASNLFAGLGSGASTDSIAAALADPAAAWATPGQSGVAEALLNNNLRQQDPAYQLDLERSRFELDAMKNPAPAVAAPFTLGRGEIRYDGNGNVIAEGSPYSPDTVVNNNLGNTNDFFGGLGAAEGENFQGFLAGGQTAARNLGQIQQLETLLSTSPTGMEGAATQVAGEFGIDLGGASGVQAAQALINQMVPAQRQPGSGPMSDADLNLFKASLPRIINQPGGNELIIDTLKQINAYDMELARITQQGIADAEVEQDPGMRLQIKRRMREEINSLQDPLVPFKQRVGATPTGQSALPPGVTIRRLD